MSQQAAHEPETGKERGKEREERSRRRTTALSGSYDTSHKKKGMMAPLENHC
jgi:hypothetical protein